MRSSGRTSRTNFRVFQAHFSICHFIPNAHSSSSVAELLEFPTLCCARQGINAAKLTKGDGEKKPRPKPEDDGDIPAGVHRSGVQVSNPDSDFEYFFQLFSKLCLAHRTYQGHSLSNGLDVVRTAHQQQTNALDVEKHMFALLHLFFPFRFEKEDYSHGS